MTMALSRHLLVSCGRAARASSSAAPAMMIAADLMNVVRIEPPNPRPIELPNPRTYEPAAPSSGTSTRSWPTPSAAAARRLIEPALKALLLFRGQDLPDLILK